MLFALPTELSRPELSGREMDSNHRLNNPRSNASLRHLFVQQAGLEPSASSPYANFTTIVILLYIMNERQKNNVLFTELLYLTIRQELNLRPSAFYC